MPIVIAMVRHSPENCAMFNTEARKATLSMMAQLEALLKKYGIKVLGAWAVSNEHLIIWVVEFPTLDAMEQFLNEPVMVKEMAFNTVEIKIATKLEDRTKELQQLG